jgi:hypothetical protein
MENLMSQIVSKQSLNALATLAFRTLEYEDPEETLKPECNLDDGADTALYDLLRKQNRVDFDNEGHRDFADAYTRGVVLGLAIAAAIVSNGLDGAATAEAVRLELNDPSRYWPAKAKEAA